ncbi:hypothetical protein MBLNU13_g07553t1 [Cladosporium sp. NU13]
MFTPLALAMTALASFASANPLTTPPSYLSPYPTPCSSTIGYPTPTFTDPGCDPSSFPVSPTYPDPRCSVTVTITLACQSYWPIDHVVIDPIHTIVLDATNVAQNQIPIINQLVVRLHVYLDATTWAYDEFNVRIHIRYDRGCFPTYDYVVVCEHYLVLDPTTWVHNKLVDKPLEFIVDNNVRLHLEHNRRRFLTDDHAVNN